MCSVQPLLDAAGRAPSLAGHHAGISHWDRPWQQGSTLPRRPRRPLVRSSPSCDKPGTIATAIA
jgi:hypothetical protein